MKRLYTKKGMEVPVIISQGNDIADSRGKAREVRYISVYEEPEPGKQPTLIFSIADGGFNHQQVIFADGLTDLPWYMVTIAGEIIENFQQYFNMLNQ